ncbi:MAG: phenylacetate--CoA ligase family protein [Clostridiales bacterium]|nr:phenylacetate--CoA ligase family protein [Clostridiales bacterium]
MITNSLQAFYYLHKFNNIAYWNKDKLINFQNKQLRSIVKYAYDNVPYYHKIFRQNGLNPYDIRDTQDINKIPILRKDIIRAEPEAFLSRQFDSNNLRCLSTSGSTGKPMLIYINSKEDLLRKARHLRANTSCGQKLLDRWVLITSPNHFGTSTKLQRILRFYVPIPVSVFSSVDEQASKIERLNPDVLDGYSSSLVLLAKYVQENDLNTIRPKFVIGGAELVDESSKRVIEDVFNVPFFDQYACVEFDRISWQCTEKVGYHIDSDSLIVQFVDAEGNEVAKGEKGEIVCTSLFNNAMPLIRYAVGDMGVESYEECSCGRKLPLMKVIEGRSDSSLVFPDGRTISPRALTVAINMFSDYNVFDQFQIIQKKIDLFHIFVKLKDVPVKKQFLSRKFVEYLNRTLNLSNNLVTFEIEFVDEIPLRNTGKLMMVISELSKNNGD